MRKKRNSKSLSFLFLCLVLLFQNCSKQELGNLSAISSSQSLSKGPPPSPTPGPSPSPSPIGDPIPLNQRINAATTTAESNSLCTAIGDFYWELGDATGELASGKIGTTYSATTEISVASASKIIFGTYLIQSTGGNLSETEKQALRMLSGYSGLNPTICASPSLNFTVSDCLNGGSPGPNYSFNSGEVGRFNYDGAHDQFLSATEAPSGGLGLGNFTTTELNSTIMPQLGNPGFKYAFPEFAGGASASGSEFGVFLSSILSQKLLMYQFLGKDAVCTLPGPSCPSAVNSPAPLAWHYSYNHWVEDDSTGDGAFSSPGAFGFYPWISADKKYYGVLVRNSKVPTGGVGPYWASVLCGQKIRAAWMAGTPK